jgi:DNA-binding beta-propeller fold protein YncE
VIDVPQRPEQLAFDRAGNLLIISYEGDGVVLAYDPANPGTPRVLDPHPPEPRPEATPILPVSRWGGGPSFLRNATAAPRAHYLSPDGTVFICAEEGFVTGAVVVGSQAHPVAADVRRRPGRAGGPFYVTNEHRPAHVCVRCPPDGSLTNPRLFVEEGGEHVATDAEGNVYIAAGQILVYNPAGAAHRRHPHAATPNRPRLRRTRWPHALHHGSRRAVRGLDQTQ